MNVEHTSMKNNVESLTHDENENLPGEGAPNNPPLGAGAGVDPNNPPVAAGAGAILENKCN